MKPETLTQRKFSGYFIKNVETDEERDERWKKELEKARENG